MNIFIHNNNGVINLLIGDIIGLLGGYYGF